MRVNRANLETRGYASHFAMLEDQDADLHFADSTLILDAEHDAAVVSTPYASGGATPHSFALATYIAHQLRHLTLFDAGGQTVVVDNPVS